MKNSFRIFCISILFISTASLNSNVKKTPQPPTQTITSIIPCKSISDLEKYAEPEVLIVIDLDNTLIQCVDGNKGSEEWFSKGIKYLIKEGGLSEERAFSKMLEYYRKVHEHASIKFVEGQKSEQAIKTIGEKGAKIIVLTSRSIIAQTFRQLKEININFANFHIPNTPQLFNLSKEAAYYLHGIMFCGSNSKGEALQELLAYAKVKPKLIVFIDDKEKHLKDVANKTNALGIGFVGLHYIFLQEQVDNFIFDPQSLLKLELAQKTSLPAFV